MNSTQSIYQGTGLKLELLEDGIACLEIDQPGATFNTIGSTVHAELADCVRLLTDRTDVSALVVASAKKDFAVGAEIGEFGELFSKGEDALRAYTAPLLKGFSALEDLPFPVVAAVPGMALGGGLELALCSDARVLSDNGSLGLPEVKLGLIPGLGGTVRLPRLIGVEAALAWISSGAQVPAAEAVAVGAADRAVPLDNVRASAIDLAKSLAADPSDWKARRVERHGPVTGHDQVDFDALKKQAVRKSPLGQPAAAVAVDLLRSSAGVGRDEALDLECKTFAHIAGSQAANAMVGAFFAERKVKKIALKTAEAGAVTATVLVLGAGIMGGGIAWACARAGKTVRIKDISGSALEKAVAEARRIADREIKRGRLSLAKADDILERIHPQLDDEGVEDADLVIEAVIENLETKRSILAALEPKLKPEAVIATNTSSLRVRDVAEALADPSRLVGMHFFNPVPVMPLLEVICAPASRPEAVATAVRCGLDLRKTPIVVADVPGFLVNRILTAYINAFCRLVDDGVDFRAIDQAMEGWGWPMGPAYLEDVVGMDTGAHVIELISAGYPERMAGSDDNVVAAMVHAGQLGQKSGSGFYRYERNAEGRLEKHESATALDIVVLRLKGRRRDMAADEIVERMMVPTLVEAIVALEEGVVGTPEELDQALLLGIGFPAYAGGCLRYADWIGASTLLAACDRLEPDVGPSCAAPESLRKLAATGGKFYG